MNPIRNRSLPSGVVLVVGMLLMASLALAGNFSESGVISAGGQFDLYEERLYEGDTIVATLICDEIAPGDRPLDPVLSVYRPIDDPSNTANAFQYNDDGFGSDDAPDGVDCNAFDSSRVSFRVPADGVYTFRVDGFGSSTGPYTLRVEVNPLITWFDPGDDRINRQAYATSSIYCDAANSRVSIYRIGAAGRGTEVLSVPYADLPDTPTDANVLIAQNGDVAFYRLTSGEYQVNSGPDAEGKTYVVVWNGCPLSYENAYILQNGVMTQTEHNIYK